MKKVLFASTALVAFSGAAVADVALSGRAEMGIFDSDDLAVDGVQFFTDIDVTFTMSGETDNGLTFGASVDLDEGGSGAAAVADNSDDGGATIFISGSFGTVTMGDTDGALDWALTEAGNVGNPGSINDDETSHAGYVGSYLDGGNDGQILRWDYSFGDFGVAVSVEDDNGGRAAAGDDEILGTADDEELGGEVGYAIGLRYNLDLGGTTVALGIGHQEAASNADGATASATGISATANFAGGFSAGIVYADWDDDDDAANGPDSNYGIGLGYTTGAFTIHANYGEVEFDDGTDVDGFGVAAAYDLGGGAVVHFGYRDDDAIDSFSLGLGLSF
jgi:outer membrane protein OmpU